MTTDDNEKVAKSCFKFHCDFCDYGTSRKSSMTKHFLTARHINTVAMTTNNNEKVAKSCEKCYSCDNCEKIFNDRPGLWRHKKKCIILEANIDLKSDKNLNEPSEKELIMLLVKENSKLQNMMMEVIKTGTHNTTTTHTNSHNKTFNLQFFLNETCKDAMNITDFVNSIQLQLSDLERVGKIGYVEGISNIITSNLKALDVTQRPIHCTDNKREVLYVKDEDKWEKEADEKDKIRKAIKNVANKNIRMLQSFKDIHPDCLKSESKYSDQYNKIVVESFGGRGDNDTEKENKIIKNISKGVTIDK